MAYLVERVCFKDWLVYLCTIFASREIFFSPLVMFTTDNPPFPPLASCNTELQHVG